MSSQGGPTSVPSNPPNQGTSSQSKTPGTTPATADKGRRASKSKDKYEGNPDHNLPGIGNYNFIKTLGEGNFAKVKLAKHKLTGQEVAIKIIDKTKLDEKKLSKLYREVKIMKLLHHPHIVKLYEVIETKATVFLVMECANGGELYDYLVVHGRMKEKEARQKFREILSAVNYCHKKRVIHRDLKAENLLLDKNLEIKIADFGFSNIFNPDDKLDTFCGSPPYAAPELFQGRKYTGPEVDVWSLGVILYVLATGCLPFDGKNLQEMRESVCRGKYRVPFYLSENCEKLLRKFLVRDPSKRANLDMLIDDPWINEGYDDSPMTSDLSERVEEDEEILQMMEKKYRMDRPTILKSLRENVYDDTAAIYYLLYHEKMLRIKGEAPGAKVLETIIKETEPISPTAATPAAAMTIIAENNATKQETPRGEEKEEDEVDALGAAAKKKGAAPPRKRRFTVAGDTDAHKATDDEVKSKIAEAAANVQITPKPLVTQISSVAGAREEVDAKKPADDQKPQPAMISDAEAASMGQDSSDERPTSARKRHNTFVGIFKGAGIRRPSDADQTSSNQPSQSNTDADGKPRSLRFTFNSNSTSTKDPEEIIAEVVAVLKQKSIEHSLASPYVISCSSHHGTLKFEIEVCKLPRLKNLHGLRFRRVIGQSSDYKQVCEDILKDIKLS